VSDFETVLKSSTLINKNPLLLCYLFAEEKINLLFSLFVQGYQTKLLCDPESESFKNIYLFVIM